MTEAGLPKTVTLRDGSEVVLRCLVPADREPLAAAYEVLSEESRRRRFFSPPKHLSPGLLDYLTNLDDDERFAVVAFQPTSPETGLGLARWVRNHDDPSRAEPAVAVIDSWQHRGLGTALLAALVDAASSKGITTFVADVLWENDAILDPLRSLGARVSAAEPGVASIEFDLPERDGSTALHHLLARAAAEAQAT